MRDGRHSGISGPFTQSPTRIHSFVFSERPNENIKDASRARPWRHVVQPSLDESLVSMCCASELGTPSQGTCNSKGSLAIPVAVMEVSVASDSQKGFQLHYGNAQSIRPCGFSGFVLSARDCLAPASCIFI